MSRKSPSQLKILNDTLDLMTLMTHCSVCLRYVRHVARLDDGEGVKRNWGDKMPPQFHYLKISESVLICLFALVVVKDGLADTH